MSIPNETLHDIFADLPAPVLAVVALACRRFNAVAERLLYSAISVDDVLSERSPNPWRTVRCASSILRRPHLVDAVRSVSVRWRTEEGTLWQPYRDLLAAATHLSSALRTLVFLQTLDIYLGFWSSLSHDGSASWRVMARQTEQLHPIDAIIQSCSFPQLSVCSLHTDWADARGTKDRLDVHVETTPTHALSSFLIASSAQLKHLRLHLPQYSSMGLFSFPSESLRELMSFRGNSRMAAAILPGRPVRSLSLEGREEEVTVEILGQLALTASDNAIGFPHGSAHTEQTLRYLDLSSIPIRPVLLRSIAAQLSDIEVLRIKLALRHTLHYAMSGIVSPCVSLRLHIVKFEIPSLYSRDSSRACHRCWEHSHASSISICPLRPLSRRPLQLQVCHTAVLVKLTRSMRYAESGSKSVPV